MRKFCIFICTLSMIFLFTSQAMAGGIDNIQNQSVKYIGTASRNAATSGTDMAHYNPAGTAFLEDGLYLQLDTQYVDKDYTQDILGTEYSQDEPSILPTLFAIYKKNNWSTFGYVGVLGGGGCAEYEDGNIVTLGVENLLRHPMTLGYDSASEQYIEAENLYYTYTIGGAYALSDMFAVSLSGRYISATKEVEASAQVNGNGNATAQALYGSDPTLDARYEQEADGFGFVIGVDFKPSDTWNFAIRYESEINLIFDTDVKSAPGVGNFALAQFQLVDGYEESRNLPGVLAFGAEIKATPKLTISPSINIYLEEQADWGDNTGKLNKNTIEFGLGIEYALTECLKLSTGYLYTKIDIDGSDFNLTNKMTPPLAAHAVALGCEYKYNDKITLQASSMLINYVSETAPADGVFPEVTYDKTNFVIALGIQYKPF